ncbi:hypothetical protein JCM11251_003543 [Rhodosporidiobolus azoricus]
MRTSTFLPSPLSLLTTFVLLLSLGPTRSLAFFEQFFHHQHQQGPPTPQAPPSYEEQLGRINCPQFVCPDFSCAPTPADCPCPSQTDEKCLLGGSDGAYICTRDCAKAKKAREAFH